MPAFLLVSLQLHIIVLLLGAVGHVVICSSSPRSWSNAAVNTHRADRYSFVLPTLKQCQLSVLELAFSPISFRMESVSFALAASLDQPMDVLLECLQGHVHV